MPVCPQYILFRILHRQLRHQGQLVDIQCLAMQLDDLDYHPYKYTMSCHNLDLSKFLVHHQLPNHRYFHTKLRHSLFAILQIQYIHLQITNILLSRHHIPQEEKGILSLDLIILRRYRPFLGPFLTDHH